MKSWKKPTQDDIDHERWSCSKPVVDNEMKSRRGGYGCDEKVIATNSCLQPNVNHQDAPHRFKTSIHSYLTPSALPHWVDTSPDQRHNRTIFLCIGS